MRKKTLGRKLCAMALAFMMALSLTATPAFAEETAPATRNITISSAVEGVTYKAYQILKLVDYGTPEDVEIENEDGTKDTVKVIPWYQYELTGNTEIDNAVKGLINGDFKVQRAAADVKETDEEGNETIKVHKDEVIGAGFELDAKGNSVMFWVPLGGTENDAAAYEAWTESSMNEYATRFAGALRTAIEAAKLEPGQADETVTVSKGQTTVTIPAKSEGYWLVTSDLGTLSMLFTNPGKDGNDNMEIKEKNQAPNLTKTVYEQASSGYETKNDVSIGSTVTYKVEIDAVPGSENLKLIDTLTTGLTFDKLLEVSFVPRGGRQVYADSASGNPEDLSSDVDLAEKSLGEGNNKYIAEIAGQFVGDGDNDAFTAKVETAGGRQTMTVAFTETFLKSLRSEKLDGAGTGRTDPMATAGDDRIGGRADKDGSHYNVFLGDMDTMEDDGGTITVIYSVIVNKDAVKNDYDENDAKLQYGHDPESPFTTSPVEPGDEPGTKVKTYTHELTIDKYAMGDPDAKLAGAKFQVAGWDKLHILSGADAEVRYDGTKIVDSKTDRKYTWEEFAGKDNQRVLSLIDITDEYAAEKAVGDKIYRLALSGETGDPTVVTGTSGKIVIKGLDSDLYAVKETEAPAGYSELDAPLFVAIGNVLNDIGGQLFLKGEDSGEFASVDGNALGIANASGVRLPDTGGIGTTIFYMGGALLVVAAGVLLVIRKRAGSGK